MTDQAPSDFPFGLDKRQQSYIHPSWLAKAISGDRQCQLSLHLQANYKIPKVDNNFDLEGHKFKHQTALTRYAGLLKSEGYLVHAEGSNEFWYNTKAGAVISAKPDLVAIRSGEAIVPEIKTGRELKSCDIAQVKLYMAMIPAIGLHGIREIPIGQLVHNDEVYEIAPSEVTTEFKQQVADVVNAITQPGVPPATPSTLECRYCPTQHLCLYKVDNVAQGSDDWL